MEKPKVQYMTDRAPNLSERCPPYARNSEAARLKDAAAMPAVRTSTP